MTIVGEPSNVDAHAKNPALFRTMLCTRLCCVYTYTVHTDCDCTVVLLTDQSIASIQGTPHGHHTDTTQSQMLSSGSPTKKIINILISSFANRGLLFCPFKRNKQQYTSKWIELVERFVFSLKEKKNSAFFQIHIFKRFFRSESSSRTRPCEKKKKKKWNRKFFDSICLLLWS